MSRFLALLLLAVAIVAGILGALRNTERHRLRAEVLAPREGNTDGGTTARDLADHLAGSLGLVRASGNAESALRERLIAIVDAFGNGEAVDERTAEVSIDTGWDRLPELVAWIAERPSIPLEELTATPGSTPDLCRVRIRLGRPAAGFGPR